MLKEKINLETDKESTESIKAVAMVVGLHLAIAFFIGFIILFLGGLMKYMLWIIGGIAVVFIASCWYFLDRLKKQSTDLAEMMQSPAVQGRAFEVKLLGGVASIKVGAPEMSGMTALEELKASAIQLDHSAQGTAQLEDPETIKRRELEKLVEMRREELITAEEFLQLKAGLMGKAADENIGIDRTNDTSKEEEEAPDIQIMP